MRKKIDGVAKTIVILFLLSPAGDARTRSLHGTMADGKYLEPGKRFAMLLPSGVQVQDRIKTIPVSHFYERAFYPVPVDIPQRATYLMISLQEGGGIRYEIRAMPIQGDTFTPLSAGLHQRTARRFLEDVILPEWRRSVSKATWLYIDPQLVKLDGIEAVFGQLLMPADTVKWAKWKPEGAKFHLTFGFLTFVKDDHLFMLAQTSANYLQQRPEFLNLKSSLTTFYRTIAFYTAPTVKTQAAYDQTPLLSSEVENSPPPRLTRSHDFRK